jgi:hypothetical protein
MCPRFPRLSATATEPNDAGQQQEQQHRGKD